MLHDLLTVLRSLHRHPVFTALVALTLGLGIGATILVFSIAEAVLLRPLPYPDSDRLVDVMQYIVGSEDLTSSSLDIPDLREETQLFEDVAARYSGHSGVPLEVGNDAYPTTLAFVSGNYFSVLGVQAALGRTFLPEDEVLSEVPGEAEPEWQYSIVITHELWETALGADESVVGGTVQVRGTPRRVVGILPQGFQFLHERRARWISGTSVQIFAVMPSSTFSAPKRRGGPGAYRGYWPLARLRQGISYEEAQAGLDVMSARLRGEFSTYAEERLSLQLLPLQEGLAEGSRPIIWVLSAGVLFLLVLICGNLASLLLVRGRVRMGDDAVRAAMGGTKARLAGQMLLETLILAVAGGAIGIGVGWVAVRVFEVLAPRTVPLLDRVDLSFPAVLFGMGAGIVLAVGFGLIPALQLRRQLPARALSSRSPGKIGGGRTRLMNFLVIGELAIAMVLLTGAAVMTRTLLALVQDDLGYDPENVVTFGVMETYSERDLTRDGWGTSLTELGERLEALPDVEFVARSSHVPLSGSEWTRAYGWDEESHNRSDHRAHIMVVTHDYFRAMGTRLLAGRSFTDSETTDSTDSVIVGESLARATWPGQDPLGKLVLYDRNGRVGRVIGVAETLLMRDRSHTLLPTIFAPEGAFRPGFAASFALRTSSESRDLTPVIRQTLRSMGVGLIAHRIRDLSESVAMSRAPTRFVVVAMSAFAAIALIVAVVGLFGVISYAVQTRTAELGIRLALGAEKSDIMTMVLWQGAVLTAIGIVVGIIGVLLLGRFMESMVFGVSPADPIIILATAVVLGAVSILACYAPARWACRLDPAQVLRTE